MLLYAEHGIIKTPQSITWEFAIFEEAYTSPCDL